MYRNLRSEIELDTISLVTAYNNAIWIVLVAFEPAASIMTVIK